MSASGAIAARASIGERPTSLPGTRVVSIVNSKGGVGKTTLANNLGVYARTVDTSLPVLVMGLDDSSGPDDMFALDEASPQETVHTALRRGCFDSAIRPGRYGVYYVPSSPRITEPLRQTVDPYLLTRALERTAFPGVVIIDCGSDFGTLTQNAIAASDLCVVPVADLASLFTAKKIFERIEEWGRPRTCARVVLSMLDQRIKYRAELCSDVLGLLVASARRLDLPLFQSFISRSPKVQALATNPEGRVYSILNEANRTNVHQQIGEVAEELLEALESRRVTKPDELAANAPMNSPEEPVAWLRPRTPEAAFAMRPGSQKPLGVHQFPFFMGRHEPGMLNDLAIEDLQPWQVSRRHAHLVRRGGRIGVMDLGSTLGTWVDGHQLGGPTADPGPVFFGAQGGTLTLGKRKSPYVFDVSVSKSAVEQPPRETATTQAVRATALAAMLS